MGLFDKIKEGVRIASLCYSAHAADNEENKEQQNAEVRLMEEDFKSKSDYELYDIARKGYDAKKVVVARRVLQDRYRNLGWEQFSKKFPGV